MSDNAYGQESVLSQAVADEGFWDEMVIPINAWTAVGAGASIGATADSGMTFGRQLMLTNTAANGNADTVYLTTTVVLPQLLVAEINALQQVNTAAGAKGPFAELLLLARAKAGGGNEDIEVIPSWLEGYGASAAWRTATNKQNSPFLSNNASDDPTALRWCNFPIFRPDIPSGAPQTAAQRLALNNSLRSNNYPQPLVLRIQNKTLLGAAEFIEIVATVLRFKRHLGNRLPIRRQLTNDGVAAVFSGNAPSFVNGQISTTGIVF